MLIQKIEKTIYTVVPRQRKSQHRHYLKTQLLLNNKMTYHCLHCSRTFSTPYALKRHISSKHPYVDEDGGESSQSKIQYEEEPGLWDDDLPIEEGDLWDDEDQMVRSR